MNISEVSDKEILELRGWYMRSLRHETQASLSVKRSWKIVIAALDEVILQRIPLQTRSPSKRVVLDATKMCRPGDEPLA
jgi:hypothetical protein